MKVTIVAATGGVGRELLGQALAAGHDVTAVVRNPDKLPGEVRADDRARVITADLAAPDPVALESAAAGADAILSGLGPRSGSDAGIASRGTRAIIAAMRATGARRIAPLFVVVISEHPLEVPGRGALECGPVSGGRTGQVDGVDVHVAGCDRR